MFTEDFCKLSITFSSIFFKKIDGKFLDDFWLTLCSPGKYWKFRSIYEMIHGEMYLTTLSKLVSKSRTLLYWNWFKRKFLNTILLYNKKSLLSGQSSQSSEQKWFEQLPYIQVRRRSVMRRGVSYTSLIFFSLIFPNHFNLFHFKIFSSSFLQKIFSFTLIIPLNFSQTSKKDKKIFKKCGNFHAKGVYFFKYVWFENSFFWFR